jgi:hypothetical protein
MPTVNRVASTRLNLTRSFMPVKTYSGGRT